MRTYIVVEKGLSYEDANDLKFTLMTQGFANVTTVINLNEADVIIKEGTKKGELEYIVDELIIKGYKNVKLVKE